MLYLDGLFGLVALALWIFCLLDVITTDESLCRNLRKTVWLLLVLLLPVVGSVAWLVAGRPQPAPSLPYKGNTGPVLPERGFTHPSATGPDDDEAYQRALRARVEEQRAAYRAQRRAELGEAGTGDTDG